MTSSLHVHLQVPCLPGDASTLARPFQAPAAGRSVCFALLLPMPWRGSVQRATLPSARLESQGGGSCPYSIYHTSGSGRVRLGTETCPTPELCAFLLPSPLPSVCADSQHSMLEKRTLIAHKKHGKQLLPNALATSRGLGTLAKLFLQLL